jgi:tRNA G26 N,N-dimethylase Trm1
MFRIFIFNKGGVMKLKNIIDEDLLDELQHDARMERGYRRNGFREMQITCPHCGREIDVWGKFDSGTGSVDTGIGFCPFCDEEI